MYNDRHFGEIRSFNGTTPWSKNFLIPKLQGSGVSIILMKSQAATSSRPKFLNRSWTWVLINLNLMSLKCRNLEVFHGKLQHIRVATDSIKAVTFTWLNNGVSKHSRRGTPQIHAHTHTHTHAPASFKHGASDIFLTLQALPSLAIWLVLHSSFTETKPGAPEGMHWLSPGTLKLRGSTLPLPSHLRLVVYPNLQTATAFAFDTLTWLPSDISALLERRGKSHTLNTWTR